MCRKGRKISSSFFFYKQIFALCLLSIIVSDSCAIFRLPDISARSLEENSYFWHKFGPTWFKVPKGFKLTKAKTKVFHRKNFSVRISALSFQPGNIAFIELTPAKTSQVDLAKIQIRFLEKEIPLTAKEKQLFGYIPLPASMSRGEYRFEVNIPNSQKKFTFPILVKSKRFASTRFSIRVSNRKIPDKILRKIAQDRKLKKRVFSKSSARSRLTNEFALPRDFFHITSPYWQKRKIRYYQIRNKKRVYNPKEATKIHRGVDLRGFKGHPIYSIARGKVVLAKHMHYEGKFIVIDHGQNIFSGYMHLSKIKTCLGKIVRAGEKIGEAGSTGVITGPHLHLFLRINNSYVNPLSIFGLPIISSRK